MATEHIQPGLFDRERFGDEPRIEAARARMHEMIERLRNAPCPPWKDQMAVFLDDGAFHRAMHLVPKSEAAALWDEYDALAARAYDIWAKDRA